MKLAIWNNQQNHFEALRDLSTDELAEHTSYKPIVVEARNRLSLFRMLDRNFQSWRAYLDAILTPNFKENADLSDELNRLLLNYLTFAYTIREHFEVSFNRRHRKNQRKLKESADCINRLCHASWAFAFFLDFRGYVQHRGLAVGRYSRTVSETSVTISIVADAAQLVKESRDWKFSKLDAAHGEIDLVIMLHEFHIQMLQGYAKYVVTVFFPELVPAASFYTRLTQEVHHRDPQARMVFHENDPQIVLQQDKASINFELIQVPNDLFGELGIQIAKKPALSS